MGFFSDIIRDSRGAYSAFTHTGQAPLDRAQKLYFPERLPETNEGGESARSSVEIASMRQFREESGESPEAAWQDQMQAEAAARQVVSPSPAQHIPARELAQVRVDKEVTPNPEAQEQTGSESDETATDASRMIQAESHHGDGSFDVPAVQGNASDSSIGKSSPESAVSRTGKTAAETQGRQQAGEARAGLTAPPDDTRQQKAAERPGLSLGELFLREPDVTPAPSGQENTEVSVSGNSASEKSAVPPSLRSIPAPPQSFAPAVDSHQKTPRAGRATEVPAEKTQQPEPPRQSWAQRDASSARRDDRQKPSSERAQRAAEPRVQIGTIEVVVLTQTPPEQSSSRKNPVQPDMASRNYLRNF
jgi:hypothetical protein